MRLRSAVRTRSTRSWHPRSSTSTAGWWSKDMWTIHLQESGGRQSDPRIATGKVKIGRDADCDVKLSGWRIGNKHAELFVSNEQGYVRDLGASSGTLVNGKAVTTYGPLTAGDKIQIGPHFLTATWLAELAQTPGPAAAPVSQSLQTVPALVSASAVSAPAMPSSAASGEAETPAKPAFQDETFTWRRMLHDRLLEAFDVRRVDVHRMADGELRARAEQLIAELIERMPDIPKQIDRTTLLAAVRDEAIGLGLLEPLLADASVTEIMVNRSDEVFVERAGVLERYPLAFTSDRAVTGIIERIVAPIGRRIDESSPMVDARLKDGSRVNAVIPPLALKGPSITIRKFAKRKLEDEDLIRFGSITAPMMAFMKQAVLHAANIVISGGTGSGKTTLLNVLSNYIPEDERIITVEDAAELQLGQPHVVSLEARPANVEGKG